MDFTQTNFMNAKFLSSSEQDSHQTNHKSWAHGDIFGQKYKKRSQEKKRKKRGKGGEENRRDTRAKKYTGSQHKMKDES